MGQRHVKPRAHGGRRRPRHAWHKEAFSRTRPTTTVPPPPPTTMSAFPSTQRAPALHRRRCGHSVVEQQQGPGAPCQLSLPHLHASPGGQHDILLSARDGTRVPSRQQLMRATRGPPGSCNVVAHAGQAVQVSSIFEAWYLRSRHEALPPSPTPHTPHHTHHTLLKPAARRLWYVPPSKFSLFHVWMMSTSCNARQCVQVRWQCCMNHIDDTAAGMHSNFQANTYQQGAGCVDGWNDALALR
jgi:hypothetical protein